METSLGVGGESVHGGLLSELPAYDGSRHLGFLEDTRSRFGLADGGTPSEASGAGGMQRGTLTVLDPENEESRMLVGGGNSRLVGIEDASVLMGDDILFGGAMADIFTDSMPPCTSATAAAPPPTSQPPESQHQSPYSGDTVGLCGGPQEGHQAPSKPHSAGGATPSFSHSTGLGGGGMLGGTGSQLAAPSSGTGSVAAQQYGAAPGGGVAQGPPHHPAMPGGTPSSTATSAQASAQAAGFANRT